MEVDDLLSSEYQEKPEELENAQSGVNSYLSQSIIGHDWMWNSEEKIGYQLEDYAQEDAELVADEYDLSLADRHEILSEGKSLQHVYDMAEDKKRNSEQLRLIESHGALGYAGMFATSALDVPSWIIGAGAGKVASIGANAYKFGRTGQRLSQAGAGAATAVASVGLLEASLGNDLTAEQIAINGAFGFTLGYAFAGLGAKSPEGITNIQKMADGTAAVDMPNQRESFMLPFLHSAADRMKTSDNPAVVEAGYKGTRSMSDNGLQSQDTLNDSLRETKTYLTTAKEDWKSFSDEFEKVNGRKLTEADEEAINKIGHKIDHEYNLVKDSTVESMKTAEKNKQVAQVESAAAIKIKEARNISATKLREIDDIVYISEDTSYDFTGVHGGDYEWGSVPKDSKELIAKHKEWDSELEINRNAMTSLDNEIANLQNRLTDIKRSDLLKGEKLGVKKKDLRSEIEAKQKEYETLTAKEDYLYENRPEDMIGRYGSVAGDDVTYLDPDGRWQDGEHGYHTDKSKYLHSVSGKLKKPLMVNEDTVAEVAELFNQLKISSSGIGKAHPDYDASITRKFREMLGKEGYDGIVINFKKDIDEFMVDDPLGKHLQDINLDNKNPLSDLLQNQVILFNPKKSTRSVSTQPRAGVNSKEVAAGIQKFTSKKEQARIKAHNNRMIKAKAAEVKRFEEEVAAIESAKKLKAREIHASDFDDASLAMFNQHAIKNGQERLVQLAKSTDKKYAKAIEIIRDFKYKHAMDLKKNDVDGLGGLDETFHWSRQYDADMIAQDTAGAVAGFHRALSANFDKMTQELSLALEEQAKGIVESILKSKSSLENIDIDKTAIQRVKGQDYGKQNVIGKNLKGRKLRLDGSELTKFMSNDIVGNMTGYSRSVGGRTAVKKVLGIDKNNKADDFATANNFNTKDRELFGTVLEQTYGTFAIDPHMNSVTSKMVRALTGVNYINFGGWFGANTLSDLSNIAYDFGLGRTTKYLTGDIAKAIKGDPNGKKLARYLGYASESLTNDRAILYGADEFAPTSAYRGEKAIAKGGALMSKLSGMNMVVDLMDRVTSFASLDYILKGVPDDKFVKTMNRLGLDMKSVNRLRNNKDLVKWDGDAISEVNFDSLAGADKANLERGLRRAISDVVLKGGDLDSPEFLTRVLGSHSLAKALFQFMRFPVIAYNKLGRKMLNNFDAIDGVVATATGAAILGLTTQMKDIGKAEPRYDLDTKEGQLNSIKFMIERMPHLAAVGLVQSQADILGRVLAQANDEDYRSYGHGAEMGVTIGRMNDVSDAMGRFMNGQASGRDAKLVKSFLSTNLAWIQPLNNVVDDKIMGR